MQTIPIRHLVAIAVTCCLAITACKKDQADQQELPADNAVFNVTHRSFGTGYIPASPERLAQIPKLNAARLAPMTERATPISGNFSLATPPIGNQGNIGSCVGWATAYTTRSAEYYYQQNHTSYSGGRNIFSASYIFNQIHGNPTDCNVGSYIADALDTLVSQGVCVQDSMPYTQNCQLAVTAAQKKNGGNYKMARYFQLDATDRQNTQLLKFLLNLHHPIVFGTYLDTTFMNADAQFVWSQWSKPEFNIPKSFVYANNIGRNLPIGGHAMAIVGYDDNKQAFKVQNQWGTYWGDNGFVWISYDFFGNGQFNWPVLRYNSTKKSYYYDNTGATVNVINEAYVIM